MTYLKNIFRKKDNTAYSLSNTIQEILQIFLHTEKSTAIHDGLTKVMSFFQADRIYIGYFDDRESAISFKYESTAEGIEEVSSFLNSRLNQSFKYTESNLPFLIGNIKNGIDTIISDMDKVPDISHIEIPLMKENHIQSNIITPIYRDGKICGFFGMDYINRKHKWTTREIENVHFFADILSITVENDHMYKEVESSSLQAFKNETLFQIIFETLPVGIELYDEKGILRKVNPYDLELLGTTEEEVLGVNLFDNPNISEESLDLLKKGEPSTFENDYSFELVSNKNYYSSKNHNKVMRLIGKCIPLKDMNNHIFGYLELVHHDPSYYQKKEELRASLAKLQMAVDAQNAFFWEYDVKNDKAIIDYNSLDSIQKEYLMKLQEEHGASKQSLFEHVHPEDIDRFRTNVERLLSGEITSFKETYREYINGELHWFSTCFQTFKYDENNKPETVVCLTTNITTQLAKDILNHTK